MITVDKRTTGKIYDVNCLRKYERKKYNIIANNKNVKNIKNNGRHR